MRRIAHRGQVERVAFAGPEAWDRHRLGSALFRQDAVHRIRRDGDDGARPFGEERLRNDVEDLVRTGADHDLVRPDPVPRGGSFDKQAVVGRGVLGQGHRKAPVSHDALGKVGWERCRVDVESDDVLDGDAVSSGYLFVGRLPRVRRWLVRRGERDRRRAHRTPASRDRSSIARYPPSPWLSHEAMRVIVAVLAPVSLEISA